MTTLVKKAGKKLFEQHLEQYAPPDPYYEFFTDEHGQKKRKKRGIPPGLSGRDAKILKSIQRRAHYLDKGFHLCGLRFGWTFFIGLIPIVGDVTDASLNYLLVVRKARQADIPKWLLQRMLFNNAISAAVGFVPFVGDVVLAMFKANSRNAILLEEFLRIRGEQYLRLQEGEAVVPSTADQPQGKKGKGISRKDAEQVKPGSGMTQGEVLPVAPVEGTSTSVAPAHEPSPDSRKSFGSYFGLSNRTPPAKSSVSGDKGKFVEHVGR